MSLGGAAVVVAYTLFAVLLALVVVVAAAWSQLDRRRDGDDRTGRALAAVMPRVEAAVARARARAVVVLGRVRATRVRRPSGAGLRGALAAGLDVVARGAADLSGRVSSEPAPAGPASAGPASAGPAPAGPASAERSSGVQAAGDADAGRDRLPPSLRDRLAS